MSIETNHHSGSTVFSSSDTFGSHRTTCKFTTHDFSEEVELICPDKLNGYSYNSHDHEDMYLYDQFQTRRESGCDSDVEVTPIEQNLINAKLFPNNDPQYFVESFDMLSLHAYSKPAGNLKQDADLISLETKSKINFDKPEIDLSQINKILKLTPRMSNWFACDSTAILIDRNKQVAKVVHSPENLMDNYNQHKYLNYLFGEENVQETCKFVFCFGQHLTDCIRTVVVILKFGEKYDPEVIPEDSLSGKRRQEDFIHRLLNEPNGMLGNTVKLRIFLSNEVSFGCFS